jgi:hypothetical protein
MKSNCEESLMKNESLKTQFQEKLTEFLKLTSENKQLDLELADLTAEKINHQSQQPYETHLLNLHSHVLSPRHSASFQIKSQNRISNLTNQKLLLIRQTFAALLCIKSS